MVSEAALILLVLLPLWLAAWALLALVVWLHLRPVPPVPTAPRFVLTAGILVYKGPDGRFGPRYGQEVDFGMILYDTDWRGKVGQGITSD